MFGRTAVQLRFPWFADVSIRVEAVRFNGLQIVGEIVWLSNHNDHKWQTWKDLLTPIKNRKGSNFVRGNCNRRQAAGGSEINDCWAEESWDEGVDVDWRQKVNCCFDWSFMRTDRGSLWENYLRLRTWTCRQSDQQCIFDVGDHQKLKSYDSFRRNSQKN